MNVVESIYNEPEKWKQTQYTFRHENGAEIWTENIPILHTNMHPSIYMGIVMKIKIWRAIRWWSKNAPIECFGERNERYHNFMARLCADNNLDRDKSRHAFRQ